MNKDFEQAYRELAQSEIPDLWDRIEAGLSEKSTPEKEQEKNQEKNRIYFGRYAGMAAAVLCAVLIVPAVLFMGRWEGKGSSASGMAAAEDQGVVEESTEAAGCALEDAEGSGWEEAEALSEEEGDCLVESAASTDAMQDSAAGAMQDVEDLAQSKENARQGNGEKAEMESADESENGIAGSLSSQKLRELTELEDGAVLEGVTIDVTKKVLEIDDWESVNEMGIVQTAIVCKDESGFFEEGEEIEIFIPIYSSVAVIEGTTIEVDLIYRSSEEYPFMLGGIH